MRLPKLIKDTILQSKIKAGNHKAIPHNSKCRYGERGAVLCGKRKTKCNYVNFSFFKQRLYFERKLL